MGINWIRREAINALTANIDMAITRNDIETARGYYKELTKAVGADSTREGFTQDLRLQHHALKRIENAEAATRRR